MKTIEREAVINRMAELANEQRQSMMNGKNKKSDAAMARAMVKKVKLDFANEEMVDDLLLNVAERKLKGNMKSHGWSAALKNAEHGDLFPDALDESNISLGGQSVPFTEAEPSVVDDQVNALIDNNVGNNRAFARSMDTFRPIQALQHELGITAGEALEILRKRNK